MKVTVIGGTGLLLDKSVPGELYEAASIDGATRGGRLAELLAVGLAGREVSDGSRRQTGGLQLLRSAPRQP